MRTHLTSPVFLASLAAAAALAMGLAASPRPSGAPQPSQEQQPVEGSITVSGTAIAPDGQPAPELPVAVRQMQLRPIGAGDGGENTPRLQSRQGGRDRYETLGKGVTDDTGRFVIRNVLPRPGVSLRVEIGERTRTPWAIETVRNEGEDIDLGEVRLRERASR